MFGFLFRKKDITMYETMEMPVVELSPVLAIGKETLELPATLRLRRLDALYVVRPLFSLPAIVDGVIPLRRKEP